MTAQPSEPHVYGMTQDHRDRLTKSGDRHKYDYGHAVIVSGPAGQGGATRLAARAALRIGAGLVSVLASLDATAEHVSRLDAIMVKPYTDLPDFTRKLTALKPAAIGMGPNFGLCTSARAKLNAVLEMDVPLCLDADAITLIAQDRAAFETRASDRIVLTPHAGELRRLIPDAFDRTDDRVKLAMTAARDWNCCVLFKGTDTLIAQPDGTCVVVRSKPFPNASWLATAGSGDVLSGFITGLLARGFAPPDAAALGAHLHLHCAQSIGPGLISEDLPEALPAVLSAILSEDADR